MKFSNFEMSIKNHDGIDYIVIEQFQIDPDSNVTTKSYITLQIHQLNNLSLAIDSLKNNRQ